MEYNSTNEPIPDINRTNKRERPSKFTVKFICNNGIQGTVSTIVCPADIAGIMLRR